jgi:hypothetical protein
MAIPRSFRFENGKLLPYGFRLPHYSEEHLPDNIDAISNTAYSEYGFDHGTIKVSYGGAGDNLYIGIHTAKNFSHIEQTFGFLLTVHIAESYNFVFCRALPELLEFLKYVDPILRLDMEQGWDMQGAEDRSKRGGVRPAQLIDPEP